MFEPSLKDFQNRNIRLVMNKTHKQVSERERGPQILIMCLHNTVAGGKRQHFGNECKMSEITYFYGIYTALCPVVHNNKGK